jgi:alpha-N-acetylglucosaminidase
MWASVVQDLWRRITADDQPIHVSARAGERGFEVHATGGGLHVAATDAVSACVGIHRYLMDACGTRMTWDADLPLRLGALPDSAPIHGQARVAEFYYLNFCTLSYSTAYWDWAEWEREIDWMALHGVTMPLQLVGHEAVLALAYSRLGMTDDEIRAFLGGPGYLPFVYMGCLDSFAGPLPADWIPRHLDLGRRILARQRELGMTPVLPAFTGHLPPQLAPPGGRTRLWQGMRTTVIPPDEPLFRRLTAEIVAAQRELLGTDHYYASDPFIEMTPAESEDPGAVATAIVDGLRAADPAATWVLQSWPFSYQADYWNSRRVAAFLHRIPPDAVVILDLWGEADPQWKRLDGYAGRPWIWNGLLNFGGRSEPVADLDSTNRNVEAALAAPHPPIGLGLTMEAVHTNPAFFELIADRAWSAAPAGVDAWIRDFGRQRYGVADPAVDRAWRALRASVLDADARSIFPELFISVAVSEPDYGQPLDPGKALFYQPADLLTACRALLEVPASGPADNDLALSCVALLLRIIDHRYADLMSAASPDPEAAARFLEAFDDLDEVAGTRPALRLETWLDTARRWGDDPVLEDNARRILTVWNTTDNHRLDNYAARIWHGLVRDYYKRRWELWLHFHPQPTAPDHPPHAAQAALDAGLARLAEEFIASRTVIEASPKSLEQRKVRPDHDGDVRVVAARVLDRYADEFGALKGGGRGVH